MTTQHLRLALADIPDRFEMLRMIGETPPAVTNQRAASPVAITPTFDNATNVALAQGHNTQPSPDELVIRQRGRRRLTTWSPEQAAAAANGTPAASPFQRTPTKQPLTSSMILRSSPRKRLTLGSMPAEPHAIVAGKQLFWGAADSPIALKRTRLQEIECEPLARLNAELPLQQLLQGMTQQQLIDIIMRDVANNAQSEALLRATLPLPDIAPLEQDLLLVKRNIWRSLPSSRLVRKTDSSGYSRASVHLSELKRLLTAHTKMLYDAAHWDALLDYVCAAWKCISATPIWDSMAHNAVRRVCFKTLACNCIASLEYGGLRLGHARLRLLEARMTEWSKDYEEVQSCVNALQKTLAKGRTSL